MRRWRTLGRVADRRRPIEPGAPPYATKPRSTTSPSTTAPGRTGPGFALITRESALTTKPCATPAGRLRRRRRRHRLPLLLHPEGNGRPPIRDKCLVPSSPQRTDRPSRAGERRGCRSGGAPRNVIGDWRRRFESRQSARSGCGLSEPPPRCARSARACADRSRLAPRMIAVDDSVKDG